MSEAGSPLSRRIAECARELGRGDVGALGRLFDTVAPRMLRYAEALTRNPEDAEDALQSAMARMARYPAALAAADYPWAYLLKTVRNEALKILGRKQPLRSLTDVMHAWAVDAPQLEHEESRLQIRAALSRLPSAQAEIVVLKIWEEMTFLEIAAVTGESPNTVASRYRYALSKLSRSLEPLVRGDVR